VAPAPSAVVSGTVSLEVQSTPAGTSRVEWYGCGGYSLGEDNVQNADGHFSVAWDSTATAACTNGTQSLTAFACNPTDGCTDANSVSEDVDVENTLPPPTSDPCTATSDPAPIAGQGYHQVFGDCFDSFDRTKWDNHLWYNPQPPAGDVYTDAGGILHIVSRRSEGYPDHEIASYTEAGSGGPRNAWRQGYFEARFKYTDATGAMPAFYLQGTASNIDNPNWPNATQNGATYPNCPNVPLTWCPAAEIDVNEHFPVNGLSDMESTVHRNTGGRWGMSDQTRSNYNGLNQSSPDLGADWHTYAVKWTDTALTFYLDGQQIGQQLATFDSTNQQMMMILYMWTDVYGPGPDASTPNDIETDVDWVRVWQQ
jgi:beta-glucanase (GH16 family)